MTEAEWLACKDPIPMLEFLRGKVSNRSFRALCGRLLPPGLGMASKYSRKAIEVAERIRATRNEMSMRKDIGQDCVSAGYWDGSMGAGLTLRVGDFGIP